MTLQTAALMVAGLSPWPAHVAAATTADAPFYPPVKPRRLDFPRDHGSHPDYRTEWWYLTGWLGQGPSAMGFQLTFFRSRTQHAPENPSRLAPTQLLFAHAAVAAAPKNAFLHANRAGRLGGSLLRAETSDTDVQFEDWHLRRVQGAGGEAYKGRFAGEGFSLSFDASAAQPALLRGQDGFSSKGPAALQASHYYSRAPLSVKADVILGKQTQALEGKAWLDHEWSSQLMMPGAVGWDWLGINLLDGGTLMAFRIRNEKAASIHAHVDARDRAGRAAKGWQGLRWEPAGSWRGKSLIDYPLPMDLWVGDDRYRLVPLMLGQEVDARASTGGFYWEGAVSLMQGERLLGHGYLELTGYGAPLKI
ncbi:lipocalin-like domain-containing protein [Limnohabitans sp. Rim47]|uniref:lipocalin-like domain-containing protein n=1 Tax=Limnohabitans sp. Rim47 TaxID=1100721 RepID=UPI000474ADBB|nr:lipocalin-like domain-containing protein [Limnohabitans sp. Rim47]